MRAWCAACVVLGSLLTACPAELASVPVRLTHGAEEQPLAGATDLSLEFFRAGVLEREAHFAPGTPTLDVGVLSFGTDLRLELSVLAGDFVIARGGSFPFDVLASSPPPRVDLHMGRLGFFTDAQVDLLDGSVVGASAGPGGALIATASGTLYHYTAHAPEDGRPRLARLSTHPELASASWLGLAGGGLIAVGGDVGRVRRFDVSGARVDERVDARLLDQRRGASLVAAGDSLWVLGGSALDFGGTSTAFTRVDLAVGAGLVVEPLSDLPCAARGSRVARIPIASGASGVAYRLVFVCADALRSSRLMAVDPQQRGAPSELTLPGDVREAALAPLGLGLLLLAGGRDAEGMPTDVVHVLTLGEASLSEIIGASRPLHSSRTDCAAHVLAPGRVLLLGGRDGGGQAMASAEIVSFPGNVVLTGQAPVPMPLPRLLALADGSVLAVASTGMAVYVPAL